MNNEELKRQAKHLEPIVRIGKSGLTEGVITQIKKAMMKRGLIKIKFLRSFAEGTDRKEAAREIATKLNATLIEQVGLVAVLYKPPVKLTKKEEEPNRHPGARNVPRTGSTVRSSTGPVSRPRTGATIRPKTEPIFRPRTRPTYRSRNVTQRERRRQ